MTLGFSVCVTITVDIEKFRSVLWRTCSVVLGANIEKSLFSKVDFFIILFFINSSLIFRFP